MPPLSHSLRFLLVALAGWLHQQQRDVLDYLQEENRVLREQLERSTEATVQIGAAALTAYSGVGTALADGEAVACQVSYAR